MFVRGQNSGGGNLNPEEIYTASATSYSGGNINLKSGQSLANFRYLYIEYQLSTSNTTKHIIMIDLSSFGTTNEGRYFFGGSFTSEGNWGRVLTKVSDTQISVGNAYKLNAAASDATKIIPLYIGGIV